MTADQQTERVVEPEVVRDWRRGNAGCCFRCGWHLSSHGSSHGPQSDCPWGASPSARDGSLAAARAALADHAPGDNRSR